MLLLEGEDTENKLYTSRLVINMFLCFHSIGRIRRERRKRIRKDERDERVEIKGINA